MGGPGLSSSITVITASSITGKIRLISTDVRSLLSNRRRGGYPDRESERDRTDAVIHGKFVSSVLLPEDFQSSRCRTGWRGGITAACFSPGVLSKGCQSPAESGCFAASQGKI